MIKWILPILILPLLVVYFVPLMHSMDIATFNAWSDQYLSYPSSSIFDFYKITGSNYPWLGSLMSVGLVTYLKTHGANDFWAMTQNLRLSLTLFDVLVGLLVLLFLSRRKMKHAGLVALLYVLLPSTWAPSGVWGQIEGFDQFILSICLFANILWFDSIEAKQITKSLIYSFVALTSLVTLLFCKQILVFGWPYLSLLALYNIVNQWNQASDDEKAILTINSCFVFSLFFIMDYSLNLPSPYKSQLAYIWWAGGSEHGNQLAHNGFNIWILLNKTMMSSSLEPLLLGLSAKQIGLSVFGVFTVYLLVRFYKMLHRTRGAHQIASHLKFAHILLIFAISQLAFNLILTGSHERYLYHFYPPFLLGLYFLFSEKKLKLGHLISALLGAVFYGFFIIATLMYPNTVDADWKHYVMLLTHTYFFIFTLYTEYRISLIEESLRSKIGLNTLFYTVKKIAG